MQDSEDRKVPAAGMETPTSWDSESCRDASSSVEVLQRLQRQYRNLSQAIEGQSQGADDEEGKHVTAMRESLDALRSEITRVSSEAYTESPPMPSGTNGLQDKLIEGTGSATSGSTMGITGSRGNAGGRTYENVPDGVFWGKSLEFMRLREHLETKANCVLSEEDKFFYFVGDPQFPTSKSIIVTSQRIMQVDSGRIEASLLLERISEVGYMKVRGSAYVALRTLDEGKWELIPGTNVKISQFLVKSVSLLSEGRIAIVQPEIIKRKCSRLLTGRATRTSSSRRGKGKEEETGFEEAFEITEDPIIVKCRRLLEIELENLTKIRAGLIDYARSIALIPDRAKQLSYLFKSYYKGSDVQTLDTISVFEHVMHSMGDAVRWFCPKGFIETEILSAIDLRAEEILQLRKRTGVVDSLRRRFLLGRKNRSKVEGLAKLAREYEIAHKSLCKDIKKLMYNRYKDMDTCFTRLIEAQVSFLSSSYGSSGPLLRVLTNYQSRHKRESKEGVGERDDILAPQGICHSDSPRSLGKVKEVGRDASGREKRVGDSTESCRRGLHVDTSVGTSEKGRDSEQRRSPGSPFHGSAITSLTVETIKPLKRFSTLSASSYSEAIWALPKDEDSVSSRGSMTNGKNYPNSSRRSSSFRRTGSRSSWFGNWGSGWLGSETVLDTSDEEDSEETNTYKLRETVTSMAMDHKEAINAACKLLENSERKRQKIENECLHLRKDRRAMSQRVEALTKQIESLQASRGLHPQSDDGRSPSPSSKNRIPAANNAMVSTKSPPIPEIPAPPSVVSAADLEGISTPSLDEANKVSGIPPPPPPMLPPLPGLPGFPGATQKKSDTERLKEMGLEPAKKYHPAVKMKRLHWEKVEINESLASSVWAKLARKPLRDELEAEFTERFDSRTFEREFCKKQRDKRKGSKTSTLSSSTMALLKTRIKIELVGPKRRRNVSIALKQFKTLTYAEIADALLTMDQKRLPASKLERLVDSFPSEEEICLVTNYTGDKKILGNVEQFFLAMSQPGLLERLNLALFLNEFPLMEELVRSQFSVMLDACNSLIRSKLFPRILYITLQLGNYMNSGSRYGDAFGFKFGVLNRLGSVKSHSKASLLKYILASFGFKKESEIEDLAPRISHASRGNYYVALADLRGLEKKLKKNIYLVFSEKISNGKEITRVPKDNWPQRCIDSLLKAEKDVLALMSLCKQGNERFKQLRRLFMLEGKEYDAWEAILTVCADFLVEANRVATQMRRSEAKAKAKRGLREPRVVSGRTKRDEDTKAINESDRHGRRTDGSVYECQVHEISGEVAKNGRMS